MVEQGNSNEGALILSDITNISGFVNADSSDDQMEAFGTYLQTYIDRARALGIPEIEIEEAYLEGLTQAERQAYIAVLEDETLLAIERGESPNLTIGDINKLKSKFS